jgi:hypothetical protein
MPVSSALFRNQRWGRKRKKGGYNKGKGAGILQSPTEHSSPMEAKAV